MRGRRRSTRSVRITGAASGLGRALALELAARGDVVFALVHAAVDAARLRR